MSDLSRFNEFIRKEKAVKTSSLNKEVWLYTRVSSNQQKENYSLGYQKEEAEKFVSMKGYTIADTFGNDSESASTDFTRREFMNLINKVRKAKRKPYGILVYVMNRFSRTGGTAITIAEELTTKLGVQLIEVSSGLDTSTEAGKYSIYSKLLEARKQNLDRLEHTIPGMKKFVSTGHCLGQVPMGYDHFGPRVVDPAKRSIEQSIVLNEDGKKLQLAWEWKAAGTPDYQILQKLKILGLTLSKQNLSSMWRRAFYCGIQTNKLVGGNAVEGKWEPMISRELFLKVQSVITENHQGYSIEKEVSDRPLTGSILCPKCGMKLAGYEVKRKKLHYYKCQKCKGVTINANTSKVKFPKLTGAHELFVNLLDSYSLDQELVEPFEFQIKKMLNGFDDSTKDETALFKKRLSELKKDKETLEEKFAFDKIDLNLYARLMNKVQSEMQILEEKYKIPEIDISNLNKRVKDAVDFSQNTSKYWVSGSLATKKQLQKLVFPEGLRLDTKNRQYLTSKVNSLFSLKHDFMRTSGDKKEKLPIISDEESSLVAEGGFEPPTFGL
jgi:site-specific DNA recombinase